MGRNSVLSALLRLSLALNLFLFVIGLLKLLAELFSSNLQDDVITEPQVCPFTANTSVRAHHSGTGDKPAVPNIVHYIWYARGSLPLNWYHMLCIFSAFKVLQPDTIYFHTNIEPIGQYWERVRQIPSLKVNRRQPPTFLFGEAVKEPVYYTSHSNVDRVKILMEYGGIYLDMDMLVLHPFDELRQRYECTIAREQETKACGSVIICSRASMFLLLWMNSYLDDYRIDEWAYNTGQVPFNLARRYPHLVHMDENRFNRPNFDELELIWSPSHRFDWSQNYAVHLWYRLWRDKSPYFHNVEPDDENIKSWNATFGEMARTILYGSPEMILTDFT